MDIATIIGLIVAFGMMYASVVMGGGRLSSFWDTASILMVFGGTTGAIMTCFPLKTLLKSPKSMLKLVLNKPEDHQETIQVIVKLAEIARKDGLLALEPRVEEIKSPFVRLGIQMAIDGTRPEVIEDVLRTDMQSMSLRHKEGKAVVDQAGRFAPAFGMIGTLLGLIIMLGNMSDPSKIGAGMAVALVTTLYGAVLSNAMFLPFAEKLALASKQEIMGREMAIRGIMAIQSGENPRLIDQKLSTWLAPTLRDSEKKEAA